MVRRTCQGGLNSLLLTPLGLAGHLDTEWASSLIPATLSYSFLSLEQLLTQYALHLQCPEIPPRVPVASLLGHLHLLSVHHQVPLAADFASRTAPVSPLPCQLFLLNSSYIPSAFHFQRITVCSSAALFRLCWPIPSVQWFVFKCHVGLPLAHKEPTPPCALLSVHELSSRCTGTDHNRLWKEWCGWSPIVMCVCVVYVVTCGLKGQQWSLRFVPIHTVFTVVTEISTMFLGTAET